MFGNSFHRKRSPSLKRETFCIENFTIKVFYTTLSTRSDELLESSSFFIILLDNLCENVVYYRKDVDLSTNKNFENGDCFL